MAGCVTALGHLGIDTEGEPDLVWIAEQAYSAPAPDQWEVTNKIK